MNSPLTLSHDDRMLLREGVLVEYAPGRVIDRKLASYRALRGAALADVLRPGYTAITYSALWVHTGAFLPGAPLLSSSHPSTSVPHNHSRRRIQEACTENVGGLRVTTPACTATDFLLLAPHDAAEAFALLATHTGLDLESVEAHLAGPESHRRLHRRAARMLRRLQADAARAHN